MGLIGNLFKSRKRKPAARSAGNAWAGSWAAGPNLNSASNTRKRRKKKR